ncbi:MAG: pantoate--beta-alanine ligase, partial [Clostridiales bacterium]
MIIEKIQELKKELHKKKKENRTIGFVPTMGYSIFVNPTQFAPNEDFESYPRDLKRDSELAYQSGADIIFHPSIEEMYPAESSTFVEVTGQITQVLCGKSRPTHFKGVTTVVNMLFNIVQPDRAYFGQKDAQQVAVLQKMVTDLHMNVELVVCPIVREEDGLAMSSRNIYLSKKERKQALILNQSLCEAEKLYKSGQRDSEVLKQYITEKIASMPLATIDYVSIYKYPLLKETQIINS